MCEFIGPNLNKVKIHISQDTADFFYFYAFFTVCTHSFTIGILFVSMNINSISPFPNFVETGDKKFLLKTEK